MPTVRAPAAWGCRWPGGTAAARGARRLAARQMCTPIHPCVCLACHLPQLALPPSCPPSATRPTPPLHPPAACTRRQQRAPTACCCCAAAATRRARRWRMRTALRGTATVAGSGMRRPAACPQAATSTARCLWARGCTSAAAPLAAGGWCVRACARRRAKVLACPLLCPQQGAALADCADAAGGQPAGTASLNPSSPPTPTPRPRPQVDEATSTVMLDTSGGAWITPAAGALTGDDLTRRCRHAVASIGPFVFIYGGLKGSQLLVRRGVWQQSWVLWDGGLLRKPCRPFHTPCPQRALWCCSVCRCRRPI